MKSSSGKKHLLGVVIINLLMISNSSSAQNSNIITGGVGDYRAALSRAQQSAVENYQKNTQDARQQAIIIGPPGPAGTPPAVPITVPQQAAPQNDNPWASSSKNNPWESAAKVNPWVKQPPGGPITPSGITPVIPPTHPAVVPPALIIAPGPNASAIVTPAYGPAPVLQSPRYTPNQPNIYLPPPPAPLINQASPQLSPVNPYVPGQ